MYEAGHLPPAGKTPSVPVVIIPHHLTAAIVIAAGIRTLTSDPPSSVLLLSPDHFNACPALLCTAAVRFRSSLGTTEADDDALKILRASPLVHVDREIFRREHGITAVIPFLSHLLPGTRVTPVVLAQRPDWKAHQSELLSLLGRIAEGGGVLLVSSDFSHDLRLSEADAADEATATTFFTRDFAGIASLANPSQSDCPACLWLAARIADEHSAWNPSVLLHTNSARLLREEQAPSTTSHFAIAFYKNAELSAADAAFGGDTTVTRADTGNILLPPKNMRAFWTGSGPRVLNLEGPLLRECSMHPNPYIFCNPLALWLGVKNLATHWSAENNHKLDRGEEGYRGTYALLRGENVMPLSEEGTPVGAMRVFALTNVMNPVADGGKADLPGQYRRVIAALRAGSGSAQSQVIYVHAGTEYRALPSEKEEHYLRSFVDAGADAVIAVHSHVPGDTEMYRGAPIFRGLGNFIFDQDDLPPASYTKAVRLRPSREGILFETFTAKEN